MSDHGASRRAACVWLVAALAFCFVGLAAAYAPLFRSGLSQSILAHDFPNAELRTRLATRADAVFSSWLVARHARTLTTRPWRLAQTEHCAPALSTLALAPPMVALGVMAVPGWLLTRDPVLAFNSAVFAMPLLGALALFLLVSDWTRKPAAGAVAAVLYGLSPFVMRDPGHAFIRDLAGAAFALFFARRWLAHGRWRDALGLGASGALQLCTSSYAIAATVFLAPAPAAWLFWRYRLRRARPAQLALVIGLPLVAAAAVLLPYATLQATSGVMGREFRFFISAAEFLPGGPRFPGLLATLLVLVSVAWRPPPGRVDPRAALLLSLVLVVLAATGAPPYALAGRVLPLLNAIRVPGHLAVGAHLLLCVFAGLGAAVLLERWPGRRGLALALALLGLAFATTLRAALEPSYETVDVRPDEATLAVFRRLAERGNEGPIAEVPVSRGLGLVEARRVALSGWHGRRTSACFGSYLPPERDVLRGLSAGLPAPRAAAALRELGFTTLFVHEGPRPLPDQFARAARRPGSPLRLLERTDRMAIFAIQPAATGRVIDSRRP